MAVLCALLAISPDCDACRAKTIKLSESNIFHSLNRRNSKFILTEPIDLHGRRILIPVGSSLDFKGGAFINGIVEGQQTKLLGDVKVERLSGSFISPVRSSYSSLKTDFEKFNMLFSLSIDELVLDEDYSLSHVTNQIVSIIPTVRGENISINVCSDCSLSGKLNSLLYFNTPVKEVSGIALDFHNHACRSAIFVPSVSEKVLLDNLTIQNIDIRKIPVSENTYIQALTLIADKTSTIQISNISGKSMKSLSNGVVGDSSGNISAIYLFVNKQVPAKVTISNCHFEDLHNYNTSGDIVLEDTNGIYVHESVPYSSKSTVTIQNVTGVDYGKRLIKTDAANVTIDNIEASSRFYDTLSAISLNNDETGSYKVALVQNVSFKGVADYVIGSALPDTKIKNLKTTIDIKPRVYCAAILPMASCAVEKMDLKGAQQIVFDIHTKNLVTIKDVIYDDTMFGHGLYANSPIVVADANLSISDVTLTSDKICQLMADYAPSNAKFASAATASIRNLTAILRRSSKDWFLFMGGSTHKWDVSLQDSEITFAGNIRAPFCIQQVDKTAGISLNVKNCSFIYHKVDDNTIPYGWYEVSPNVNLSFDNCKTLNKSGRDFSKSIHGMYIVNKGDKPTYNNLKIARCKIGDKTLSSEGQHRIHTSGKKVEWRER